MPLKPPTTYAKPVRQTLHWLVDKHWVDHPLDAAGEDQYLLCHAVRLHESLTRLPKATDRNRRCLVVGSWGLEVPYLVDQLGWTDVTCISAPNESGDYPIAQSNFADANGSTRPAATSRAASNGISRGGASLNERANHYRASRQTPRPKTITRPHPNEDREFKFHLLEHDLESGPMPFDDDTFGLVVFWGCFEHLRHDPEFGLYEINRVTATGGVVSLVTDNAISFQMTHAVLRGQPLPMRLHHPAPEGHWRLYTPPEIAELLKGTGWNVELLTSIVPDPPVYWKWWKRWLFNRLVSGYRRGFGLAEPYWNAFVLAHASKTAAPSRQYPTWLYKDEKILALKREMLDLVTARVRPIGA